MRTRPAFFLIASLCLAPLLAEAAGPVFTDTDLEKYGSSTGQPMRNQSQPPSPPAQRSPQTYSPLEKDIRGRKNEVVAENRDYIEKTYQWMKTDCNRYTGEMKEDCLFGTESWQKEELQKAEELRKYLSR